jgi:hypothetical protein
LAFDPAACLGVRPDHPVTALSIALAAIARFSEILSMMSKIRAVADMSNSSPITLKPAASTPVKHKLSSAFFL